MRDMEELFVTLKNSFCLIKIVWLSIHVPGREADEGDRALLDIDQRS